MKGRRKAALFYRFRIQQRSANETDEISRQIQQPGLAEILINDHLDGVTAEALVKWAQDALDQGHENAPLLKLAIKEPPYFTPDLRRLYA